MKVKKKGRPTRRVRAPTSGGWGTSFTKNHQTHNEKVGQGAPRKNPPTAAIGIATLEGGFVVCLVGDGGG